VSTADDPMSADLVAWGRVLLLETTGRRSGLPRRTPVGFLEEPDGSLLVAARDETTRWAQNLRATPRCTIERAGAREERIAEPLGDAEAREVAVGLILRYGTPAEGLGGGPAFRLRRSTTGAGISD